jgi:EAL and modified HD-GYP domain-containing signal transduction protein
MRSQSNIVLGRQPILDRAGRLVAYELLFRAAADQTEAVIDDNALATASVVTRAFRPIGIQTVVGGCRAFVNQGYRSYAFIIPRPRQALRSPTTPPETRRMSLPAVAWF